MSASLKGFETDLAENRRIADDRGKAMARAGSCRRKGSSALSERNIQGVDEEAEGEIGAEAVARYLADMTRQLESMARASKLELLAYLLAMARAEAENLTIETRSDPKSIRR